MCTLMVHLGDRSIWQTWELQPVADGNETFRLSMNRYPQRPTKCGRLYCWKHWKTSFLGLPWFTLFAHACIDCAFGLALSHYRPHQLSLWWESSTTSICRAQNLWSLSPQQMFLLHVRIPSEFQRSRQIGSWKSWKWWYVMILVHVLVGTHTLGSFLLTCCVTMYSKHLKGISESTVE